MKRAGMFAVAISLLVSSCVTSQLDVEETFQITKTNEHAPKILATDMPSASATIVPSNPKPTPPLDTVVPPDPTSTKTIDPGLATLDCSPAFQLKQLGLSNKPQGAVDLDVSGNFAYVLDNEGLWVIDVSKPTDPIYMGFIPMLESKQIHAVEGYIYGIDKKGLWVLDLENPVAPELIGFKDTPDMPLELSIYQGVAYVRDDHGIIRLFEIANPKSITEIGMIDPPGQILGQEIYGNLIFTMRELAISNPLPSFSFADDYLYVADLDGGIQVLDISEPSRPTDIGSNALRISDVMVVGDYVYIYEVDELQNINLWVFDISSENAIDAPSHLGMSQVWWNMTADGLCTFISGIYDMLIESDAIHPARALFNPMDFISPLKGVEVVGDKIFVADEEQGLFVLQINKVED